MELREPKRKRVGPHIKPQQPFPIPIESENRFSITDGLFPLYIGNFIGDAVVIYNTEDILSLYKMGFFGKGSFSRGYPSFSLNKKGTPPVLKERQWKRRKLWAEKIKGTIHEAQQNENMESPPNEKVPTKDDSLKSNEEDSPMDVDTSKTDEPNIEEADENKTVQSKTDDTQDKSDLPENNSNNLNKNNEKYTNENDGKSQNIDIQSCDRTNVNSNDSTKCENSDQPCLSSNLCEAIVDMKSRYQSLILSADEPCNEVLVLADSDDEHLESVLQNPNPHLENEEVKTVMETLNLTLEEAFFLSFGLGCLQVCDLLGQPMSILQLWQTFCEVKTNFIESYVCYHHFRAKGWVVKSGYKFGGDFLLYKQGPPFYHASYIVLVEKVDNQLRRVSKTLTWAQHHGLNRLAENSGKDVIICQVVVPNDVSTEDLKTPKSLPKYQVNEQLIKRWIPSQERTDAVS